MIDCKTVTDRNIAKDKGHLKGNQVSTYELQKSFAVKRKVNERYWVT